MHELPQGTPTAHFNPGAVGQLWTGWQAAQQKPLKLAEGRKQNDKMAPTSQLDECLQNNHKPVNNSTIVQSSNVICGQ